MKRIAMLRQVVVAVAVCSTAVIAHAAPGTGGGSKADVCSLATSEEFQRAYEDNPQFGITPEQPTATEMAWGPHCDYSAGSITLFTKKSPSADLERVLAMSKAGKQVPVQGLGERAFFTTVYPDDQYRRRGLLAVFVGSRIVAFTMDAYKDKPLEATRPRLESLAKLVLPRLQ